MSSHPEVIGDLMDIAELSYDQESGVQPTQEQDKDGGVNNG